MEKSGLEAFLRVDKSPPLLLADDRPELLGVLGKVVLLRAFSLFEVFTRTLSCFRASL